MEKQDNFKRSQLRIPQETYNELIEYTEQDNISLNSSIIKLVEIGLEVEKRDDISKAKVKVIKLKNGNKRLVYGKLSNSFDVDFTQDLSELKNDIELSLEVMQMSKVNVWLASKTKNIAVYRGHNHLDIVDNGVCSLGWLMVEDHLT